MKFLIPPGTADLQSFMMILKQCITVYYLFLYTVYTIIQSVPNTRKLRIARPTGNLLGRGMLEVVSRTTTKIPALILWLEHICSSSKRNRKVKWEGNSPDVTENAQSGYLWPLNTPRIFEGIPVKRAAVRQPKLKQPHSLSRFGELQQCEVCSCTPFLLGSPTNKSHKH
jgi:hypothetical protein